MPRPPHLAVAVAALSAVVVPLRTLHAFDALSGAVDLVTLAFASRVLWSLVATAGLGAVGYAYGRGSDDAPRLAFGVALAAAFVGALLGYLFVRRGTDASAGGPLSSQLVTVGTYASLDAALFALLVLGGYALGSESVSTRDGRPR